MEIPFVIGGAYKGFSLDVNAQEMVNCHLSHDIKGGAVKAALVGTPGIEVFADLGSDKPVRGLFSTGDMAFAVSGDQLYSIDERGAVTNIGTVGSDEGPASMAWNGFELVIVDGDKAYYYSPSTGTLGEAANCPVGGPITFIDTYIAALMAGSGRFYYSSANSGINWDVTDFATAEGDPDNVVSIINNHRELWLFGRQTSEIWYLDSNVGFTRAEGAFVEAGCAAKWSTVKMDNGVYWLGRTANGMLGVLRAYGYQPEIISPAAINYQIENYSKVDDAEGWVEVDGGHHFYVLTFPTADETWVYDAAIQEWHKRSSGQRGGRWRARWHVYLAGNHLVGDYETGYIGKLRRDLYTEYNNTVYRTRTTTHSDSGETWIKYKRLELDFEGGVGLQSGQGNDPEAMLQWSDDGGHTWSNEHWRKIGKVGKYGHRAVWRRLGRSTKRVWRLMYTDPTKFVLLRALAKVDQVEGE